jgi:hypothetical protein
MSAPAASGWSPGPSVSTPPGSITQSPVESGCVPARPRAPWTWKAPSFWSLAPRVSVDEAGTETLGHRRDGHRSEPGGCLCRVGTGRADQGYGDYCRKTRQA